MQRPGAPLSYNAEKELRKLLEGRESELEQKRRRTSRVFTRILLVAGITVVAAILLIPDKPRPPGKTGKDAKEAAEAASKALSGLPQGQLPQVFAPVAEDKEMAGELKPFTVKPGAKGNKDDLRLVTEVLNFMQPGASAREAEAAKHHNPQKPEAKPATPTETPHVAGHPPARK